MICHIRRTFTGCDRSAGVLAGRPMGARRTGAEQVGQMDQREWAQAQAVKCITTSKADNKNALNWTSPFCIIALL